jgi:hypothetical protein
MAGKAGWVTSAESSLSHLLKAKNSQKNFIVRVSGLVSTWITKARLTASVRSPIVVAGSHHAASLLKNIRGWRCLWTQEQDNKLQKIRKVTAWQSQLEFETCSDGQKNLLGWIPMAKARRKGHTTKNAFFDGIGNL